jgi:hypothetical protein
MLERKHPHWRVALAVGDTPPQRWLGSSVVRSGIGRSLEPLVAHVAPDQRLSAVQRAAVGMLALHAYYDELLRARAAR